MGFFGGRHKSWGGKVKNPRRSLTHNPINTIMYTLIILALPSLGQRETECTAGGRHRRMDVSVGEKFFRLFWGGGVNLRKLPDAD